MNCEEWINLNIFEQRELSVKVLHLIQNSSTHFQKFAQMVKAAEKKGLLNGIEIQPPDWANVPPDETVNNIDNSDKTEV